MNILTSGYGAASNYAKDYPSYKMKHVVEDMKKSLHDPKLPEEYKQEIATRIAAFESNSKSRRAKADLLDLGLKITNFVSGSMLGPFGSGISTLATSKVARENEIERKVVVHRAKKVGGVRRAKKGQSKYQVSSAGKSYKPDSKSVKDSTVTGVTAVGMKTLKSYLPSPTAMLNQAWSAISSYF